MIKIINRSMSIPIPDRVIGHVGDNLVETRTFELNRYYGEVDLSEFSFKLDTEIDGNKNIIDLDKTVEDDKITLTWTVYASHVLHAGRMTIQLRAFHDDIEKWHSAQDYVIIQDSTNAADAYSSLLPSEFEQMELRVTTLKEQAEASAQTATEQANRAQGIADEFENETLPAAIAAVEAAGQAKVDLAAQQTGIATAKAQEASDSAAAALASEQAAKTSEINAAGSAQTALQQANRAQGIADTFENVTLPASISAVEAAGQAKVDEAEQQASIAAGHAQTAAAKAEETSGYVNDAFEYKEAAEGAASIATEKAWEAANSAQIAEQQAGIAATKATEAYDSAERAKMSEEAVEGVADEHRLKIAKLEKELNDYKATMQQINVNQEATQSVSGYGIVSLPKNAANGQFSDVVVKGQTWTNRAGVGDTSPQTVSNLDITKTYLLINDAGANVTIDTIDTPTPVKLTGDTEFDFVWASGKIALYELSAEETALDASVLGQKYHYVNDTKSTVSAMRLKSVGKNLANPKFIYNADSYGATTTDTHIITSPEHKSLIIPIEPNTTYTVSKDLAGTRFRLFYFDKFPIFNETKSIGGILNLNASKTITFTPPANAKYVVVVLGTASEYNWVQLERGTVATPYEPYTESTQYIIAKDSEGKIAELRSLPNGVKDEISFNAQTGQWEWIQKNNETILNGNLIYDQFGSYTYAYRVRITNWSTANNAKGGDGSATAYSQDGGYTVGQSLAPTIDVKYISLPIDTNYNLYVYVPHSLVDSISGKPAGTSTLDDVKNYLNQYPITLTYQLATPIEKPIQVSGSLVSYPSGTVYIEPFVADAGIYVDKMSVLHQDLPIKVLEKLSKIDFMTGLETELDVSDAVIAEDKLSFTHPDLVEGDIVFFVYEHGAEGTIPETEISYYDSRYVIKGEDDKFYKWEIEAKLVEGVITPSIKLVEV